MPARGFTHESARSQTVEWYTPPEIFARLACRFDMDVCSPGKDAVSWIPATRHLTKAEDGLLTPWSGLVWMNPPYGRMTRRWVAKFLRHGNGIALLFSRTDTEWFHVLADAGATIIFLRKRIAFRRNGKIAENRGGCGSLFAGLGKGAEILQRQFNQHKLAFAGGA